jgi:hypothetical protein
MKLQLLQITGRVNDRIIFKNVILILHSVEQWIVCTPLSVKVFVTLATRQHFEYRCKNIFETPC